MRYRVRSMIDQQALWLLKIRPVLVKEPEELGRGGTGRYLGFDTDNAGTIFVRINPKGREILFDLHCKLAKLQRGITEHARMIDEMWAEFRERGISEYIPGGGIEPGEIVDVEVDAVKKAARILRTWISEYASDARAKVSNAWHFEQQRRYEKRIKRNIRRGRQYPGSPDLPTVDDIARVEQALTGDELIDIILNREGTKGISSADNTFLTTDEAIAAGMIRVAERPEEVGTREGMTDAAAVQGLAAMTAADIAAEMNGNSEFRERMMKNSEGYTFTAEHPVEYIKIDLPVEKKPSSHVVRQTPPAYTIPGLPGDNLAEKVDEYTKALGDVADATAKRHGG
jgi:hypothetical protein